MSIIVKNGSSDPSILWTDRLRVEGTWCANLFQFILRSIQRLSQDLKLPFQLGTDLFRRGESGVHEAIREALVIALVIALVTALVIALVNALVHADYQGDGGIVIEKYTDRPRVLQSRLTLDLARAVVPEQCQRMPQQVTPDNVHDDRNG